ncbi:MAG TPA: GDSL-type esterase/lipase family protein [Candidatus Binatia bacterium]|nr:GDSL-type esterase/lipase family protein [Candidatus Binatia bacterium]
MAVVRRLLLVLLGLAGSIAAVEGVLAWIDPASSARIHYAVRSGVCCERDPDLLWRLRPGMSAVWRTPEYVEHSRTDRRGMRGPERSDADARPLVLAVGDSTTYGVGVDETDAYPAVLEGLLRERGVPGTVLNAGVPGYGFDQTYRAALRRIDEVAPDLVLAGVHCTDLAGDWDQSLYDIRGGELTELRAAASWTAIQFALYADAPPWLRHSQLYQLLVGDFAHADVLGQLPSRDPAALRRWQRDKIVLELATLAASGRRAGDDVVAVIVPCKEDLTGESKEIYGDLAERLTGAGVATVDASADLRAGRPALAPLFYQEDIHLRPAGNRWLAERVAEGLLERGLPRTRAEAGTPAAAVGRSGR